MESHIRTLMNQPKNGATVNTYINHAISKAIAESNGDENVVREFGWFKEELGDFDFALTRPYFDLHEKNEPNSGGLFSITINPTTCKGCMECVNVCDDGALKIVPQTEDSVGSMRKQWDLWLDLPNTPKKYNRIDSLEEKIGPLETILLNKDAYLSFASGDGACLGCSEKSVVHLFVATVESLMQPRIEKHLIYLDELIGKLEKIVQQKLITSLDISDTDALARIIHESQTSDLKVADLAQKLDREKETSPVDQEWLMDITRTLAKLKKS